ncbi:hypothetical protein Bca4012_071636 [Brassica carinata]
MHAKDESTALLAVLDEVLPVGDGVLGFEQWLGDGSFSVRSFSVVALFLLVVLCLAETEGFKPYLFSGIRSLLALPSGCSTSSSSLGGIEDLSQVRWTMDLGLAPLLRLSVSTLVSSLVCSRRLPVWLVNDFSGVASSIAKRFSSLAAWFEDVSFLWLMLMKYRLNPWLRVFSCNSPAIGSGKVIDFCRLCVS